MGSVKRKVKVWRCPRCDCTISDEERWRSDGGDVCWCKLTNYADFWATWVPIEEKGKCSE